MPKDSSNSGGFSFAGQEHLQNVNPDETIIQLTTFDSRLGNSKCPSVIKTDLEGMDVRALRGGAVMIKKCRPVIYLEAFAPLRNSWKMVDDFLVVDLGYKCYYDSFRTVPSDASAHYPLYESEKRRGKDATFSYKRLGALSFNWICHHEDETEIEKVFEELVEGERITPVVDVETDSIYKGGDCEEVDRQMKEQKKFDFIIGGERQSLC